jgi:hypothetical protein
MQNIRRMRQQLRSHNSSGESLLRKWFCERELTNSTKFYLIYKIFLARLPTKGDNIINSHLDAKKG